MKYLYSKIMNFMANTKSYDYVIRSQAQFEAILSASSGAVTCTAKSIVFLPGSYSVQSITNITFIDAGYNIDFRDGAYFNLGSNTTFSLIFRSTSSSESTKYKFDGLRFYTSSAINYSSNLIRNTSTAGIQTFAIKNISMENLNFSTNIAGYSLVKSSLSTTVFDIDGMDISNCKIGHNSAGDDKDSPIFDGASYNIHIKNAVIGISLNNYDVITPAGRPTLFKGITKSSNIRFRALYLQGGDHLGTLFEDCTDLENIEFPNFGYSYGAWDKIPFVYFDTCEGVSNVHIGSYTIIPVGTSSTTDLSLVINSLNLTNFHIDSVIYQNSGSRIRNVNVFYNCSMLSNFIFDGLTGQYSGSNPNLYGDSITIGLNACKHISNIYFASLIGGNTSGRGYSAFAMYNSIYIDGDTCSVAYSSSTEYARPSNNTAWVKTKQLTGTLATGGIENHAHSIHSAYSSRRIIEFQAYAKHQDGALYKDAITSCTVSYDNTNVIVNWGSDGGLKSGAPYLIALRYTYLYFT